ncbi:MULTISPECIES: DUF2892 domain-containing protein [Halorussus]|uniref:DUF2892 domain-containing protein n=1 Tax=Halorussus TaxID=1070314 RepID=UPI00209F8547|nr:DUF2892 domain-containing protein [Halorussus vallis]USZ74695.1 DUF2892 domain-containing protein [Halorussus vallis]
MELRKTLESSESPEIDAASGLRGRVARGLLAVVLAVLAVSSLRKGKRLRGVLAGAGAIALGAGARNESGGVGKALDIDTETATQEVKETLGVDTSEKGGLRCAICGEPIRSGERRGPDENGDIVHDACKEAAQ